MCLAAWLAVATGIGFTATGAAWLRGTLAVLAMAAVTVAAASILRRLISHSVSAVLRHEQPPLY